MRRTSSARLPLHRGRCPPWLFPRMRTLAAEISEAIVLEHGTEEFLRRISDAFFFQSLGCVLGYDWHSSGLTTTTTAALKEGINPRNLGVVVCGGKGAASRKTPQEVEQHSSRIGLSTPTAERLAYSSRMAAKVDSALVQDGYPLYHHSFFLSEKGSWAVVQQGMNCQSRYARRYHWLSDTMEDFVNEPHQCVSGGRKQGNALNMAARESEEARKASVDIVNDNPQHLRRYLEEPAVRQALLSESSGEEYEPLILPRHEPILSCELTPRVMEQLQRAYEIQPENYEELVSLRGIGPKSIRALALASELIYGCKASWKDPAKFSFAHGGKDGYPELVDRERYDRTIEVIKAAIADARLGEQERMRALRRLSELLAP